MANTKSIILDGSTQYVNDEDNYWKPADYTFECWVKPDALANRFCTLVNDDVAWYIAGNKQRLEFRYGAGTYETKDSTTNLTSGVWNHVAISYKSSTKAYAFYLNGQPDGNGTTTNTLAYGAGTVGGIGVGARYDGVQKFDGLVDEFRAWADIRSATEILDNYRTDAPAGDNLYIQLHLDDNTTDSSSNNFNFAAQGSPSYSTDVSFTEKNPMGGTITTDGSYRVHKFVLANSGTAFTTYNSGNVQYLVVAGGGGGGWAGGGGGAGGYLTNASFAVTAQAYTVTVGDGGAGGTAGSRGGETGGDSIFSTITSKGGGGGGGFTSVAAKDGGSGGGGGLVGNTAKGNTLGGSQGNNGGTGSNPSGGGGGGGASAVGSNAATPAGGAGGAGTSSDILVAGSGVYRSGGGGGGSNSGAAPAGGNGGGGAGGSNAVGVIGTSDTGGGGGGGADTGAGFNGAKGGSGIVIIRYLTSDFLGASATTGISMSTNTRFMG